MKKWMSAALIGMLSMNLVACGSSSAASTESTTTESTQTEKPAEEAKEGTQLSGKVVVYCPSPAGLADKVATAFTAATGVEVEMFQGTTGEILARLEAEKQNPVADVVIMASWADGLQMVEKDEVLSYEIADLSKVQEGWVDADHKIYGYSASAAGVIYNTTLFEEMGADWNELGTNADFKDMIAIPDPLKSGSCKDFLSGFVTSMGEDAANAIIDSWVANGLVNPGANKAALEAVTTGEKGILIAGVDYNAYSSMAKGEPLNIYYPESGTVINPRPAMILKTSQNLDNAKAFMDFLFSDEAQQLVCDAYLLPGRSDVMSDLRPNVADIPTVTTDWSAMMSISEQVAENLVNSTK